METITSNTFQSPYGERAAAWILFAMIFGWGFQSPCGGRAATHSLKEKQQIKYWFQSPYGEWSATVVGTIGLYAGLFQSPCGEQTATVIQIRQGYSSNFQSPCGEQAATCKNITLFMILFRFNHLAVSRLQLTLYNKSTGKTVSVTLR